MRVPVPLTTGLLVTILGPALPAALHAQMARAPLPVWEGVSLQGGRELGSSAPLNLARFPSREAATRSHTGTGLLIGGLVGAAVTTVFLIGFCSDPDTSCQADEVGRAALVFAVPAAAVGALIGALVRTES